MAQNSTHEDVLNGTAQWAVIRSDCYTAASNLPEHSLDAAILDPPSGIAFMGRAWDTNKGGRTAWIAWLCNQLTPLYRALKPGAHLLVWGLPKTYHWTATAVEDAGFETRDVISHLFGTGYPKSLNVSKSMDGRQISDANLVSAWVKNLGPRDLVARVAGVTPRQVDHWVGESTPCPQLPTADRFRKLCEHFGHVPSWADSMYPKLGECLGTILHGRSGGDDFAKIPGSKATPRVENVYAPATVPWNLGKPRHPV